MHSDASFKPCTWETEAGGSLWVWWQFDLYSKFQESQGYIERPCIKQTNKSLNKMLLWGDGDGGGGTPL